MAPDALNRRQFFQVGAAATAAAGLSGLPSTVFADTRQFVDAGPQDLIETTIAELQARMEAGQLSAVKLVRQY